MEITLPVESDVPSPTDQPSTIDISTIRSLSSQLRPVFETVDLTFLIALIFFLFDRCRTVALGLYDARAHPRATAVGQEEGANVRRNSRRSLWMAMSSPPERMSR